MSQDKKIRVRRARASGGEWAHLVNVETKTALCGHKPKSNRSRHMLPRARWLIALPHRETCPKCQAKQDALGDRVEVLPDE